MSIDIEKLQRSNDELREIINNSWDGIGIIDKKGMFIYINNAFSPILGYPKEEIVKKYFYNFMLEEQKEIFEKLIQSTLKDKYSNSTEITCKRKDRKNVYLNITLSQMLNQEFFVLNARDITKQKSDSMILNQYVISSHFDIKGNFTSVSDAFLYVTGYESGKILHSHYESILTQTDTMVTFEEIKEIIDNYNYFTQKIAFIKADNTPFWADIKIQPVFNKYGDITGYTALMFDITNEILLKDKNITLTNQVNVAQDEIKQKDKILADQTKFAIMAETLQLIAHQWRQPLNVISLKAQKMELDISFGDAIDTDNMINSLIEIKDKSNELSKTIEDFQKFIQLKDEKRTCYPKEIIDKAVEIFSNSKDFEKLDFIKEIENSTQIYTYPNEISTILVNILTNSKEAIVGNNIKNGVIKLKEYCMDNKLFFEISDNGGGIKEEILEKIFEPYFSTKEKQHGVGLGLYACKIVIQNHLSGTIEAKNHSSGATIKISIPIN